MVEFPFLPYGRQTIEDDDVEAVTRALRSDYLTTGPLVHKFDAALAAKVGAQFGVCCSSGTAALHLASLALGYSDGDIVVVPALTFVATANAARYTGAEILFCDVDPETGLMGAEQLDAALAACRPHRPRAVHVVHLNGQAVNMAETAPIAKRYGLAIVEDACHAFGASYRRGNGDWVAVGSARDSDAACFSYHPVKSLTTAEGGAVTTNDENLTVRIAALRSHGVVREQDNFEFKGLAFDSSGMCNPWYYELQELGYNYRLPDLLCALGLSQLAKLDTFVSRRKALADRYDRNLKSMAELVRRPRRVPWSSHALHLYVVHIDFAAANRSRGDVMRRLKKCGIGTQVHYIPVHMQPYYRKRYPGLSLPGAERYYQTCLSLPIFPTMTDADVDRVSSAVEDVLK